MFYIMSIKVIIVYNYYLTKFYSLNDKYIIRIYYLTFIANTVGQNKINSNFYPVIQLKKIKLWSLKKLAFLSVLNTKMWRW